MYLVRAIKETDIDQFLELARMTKAGFTSLSIPEDDIVKKIQNSIRSYGEARTNPGQETYILVLEDRNQGRIIGMSAVKTGVGLNKPFFNYRVFQRTQYSKIAKKYFHIDVMMLVNDFANSSEISMLFVHPDHRGGGSGHLISQSRYMMMAAGLDRFNDQVISELRGVVDENGHSLFWENIGQKFFDMSFTEAEVLNAETDNQFIVDLMPRFPIYVHLLPPNVAEIIGQPHPEGVGALRLLEKEGFIYDRVIDIFDAGPLVFSEKHKIRTIRESFQTRLEINRLKGLKGLKKGLISTDNFSAIKVVFAELYQEKDRIFVEADSAEALSLQGGERVRVWIKQED